MNRQCFWPLPRRDFRRLRSGRMAVVVAGFCLLTLSPAIGVDADGWAELPAEFSPGSCQLRLLLGGQPLSLSLPSRFDPSSRRELRIEAASGVTITLRGSLSASRPGGVLRLLYLGQRDARAPLVAEVRATFPELEAALPARVAPGANDEVAFFSLDGRGLDVARGLYSSRRDQAYDFGRIDRRFRIAPARGARTAGGKAVGDVGIIVSGAVPSGRQVNLFAWELRDDVFGLRGSLPTLLSRQRVDSFALRGWRIDGVAFSQLAKTIAKMPSPDDGVGRYLEIGDGWQSRRKQRLFDGPERRWWTALRRGAPEEENVPATGATADGSIQALVRSLGEEGWQVGLWIMPFGHSDDSVYAETPAAFVHDGDGKPVKDALLGKYVVDPTRTEGREYLHKLAQALQATGCSVLRLGGLGRARYFYGAQRRQLAGSGLGPLEVLKSGLGAMRSGADSQILLAGDRQTPRALVGFLDAVRPTAPEASSVTALGQQGWAAAHWIAGHNLFWQVEAPPLPNWAFVGRGVRNRLRSQVLLAAFTGRSILLDAPVQVPEWLLPSLSQARVIAGLRSVDAFPRQSLPSIWVVRGNDAPTAADQSVIVGVFNFSELRWLQREVRPQDVGLRRQGGEQLVWFDIFEERFLGAGWAAREFLLAPGESRFFSMSTLKEQPSLVAASGHVLGLPIYAQGPVRWDATRQRLIGTMRGDWGKDVDGGRLHLAIDAGRRPIHVEAPGVDASFSSTGRHMIVRFSEMPRHDFSYTIEFEPQPSMEGSTDTTLTALAIELDEVARRPLLRWDLRDRGLATWDRVAAFEVARDGNVIARTADTRFLDESSTWGGRRSYSVRPLPPAGVDQLTIAAATAQFLFPVARDAYLDDWSPQRNSEETNEPVRGRAVLGGPLLLGGKRFERGWGVQAPARLDFRLDGAYDGLSFRPGVDDVAEFGGSVVFVVLVDSTEIYRSERCSGSPEVPEEVRLTMRGGQVLSLVVEDGGDGNERDYANWCDVQVTVKRDPAVGEADGDGTKESTPN